MARRVLGNDPAVFEYAQVGAGAALDRRRYETDRPDKLPVRICLPNGLAIVEEAGRDAGP